MGDKVAIGVDLGGTKTLALAYSESESILAYEQISTDRYAPPEVTLAEVAALVRRLIARAELTEAAIIGIGVGVAGLVSRERIFIDSIILPTWFSVDVGAWLSGELQARVIVDNDATMAAIGEWWAHKGDPLETLLCLTLGTGVGAAVLVGGQPLRGSGGTAGQLGHITVDLFGRPCSCGSKGCLNAYVSGTAIAERYLEQIASNSGVGDVTVGEPITGRWVSEAAQRGDQVARDVIEKTALYLGAGLASLVNVFNPDVIALSGGVSELGEVLLGSARAVLRDRAFRDAAQRVRVKRCRFGTAAGAIGAAISVLAQKYDIGVAPPEIKSTDEERP